MSSTPGRRTHSAAKRKQCGNCAHNWMRHPKDEARYPLQRCLTGVSQLNPRGTCACTRYVAVTAVRRYLEAR